MKTGRKPSRLLVVTPYIEDRAIQAAKSLKIEVYTNVQFNELDEKAT